jgi:hypothetical protein
MIPIPGQDALWIYWQERKGATLLRLDQPSRYLASSRPAVRAETEYLISAARCGSARKIGGCAGHRTRSARDRLVERMAADADWQQHSCQSGSGR